MSRPAAPPSPLDRALRALGLARTVVVHGVRYRPRARHAGAWREYDVRFPSGERMRIRPGPQRRYPDLTGEGISRDVLALERHVRPGMRVLVLGSGAGLEAAYLSRLVGPSGSVVALERDGELVRYARRRYPAPNVAHEIGGAEALEGELDGAFDGVLVLSEEAAGEGRRHGAIDRVLELGGWLMLPGREERDGERRFALSQRDAGAG